MPGTESRPRAIALPLAIAAASVPCLYAGVRIATRALAPEPDPAVVIWSAHSPFLDAWLVTAFLAALLALGLLGASRRSPRALTLALYAATALSCAAQIALVARAP